MGYFDSIKTKPPLTPVEPLASNVTPIRRTHTDGLHPYARAVIDAELGRLDQCRVTPIGQPPHWDETTFSVACNLLELANSPWSGYTAAQARGDLEQRAPRDHGFGDREIAAKWASAEKKVGASPRPEPTATDTAVALTVLGPTAAPAAPDLDPAAEDEFWDARPLLRHLHDFARARMVSPWAVLGVALARVVTATPNQVHLPPIVGSKASLNLFVGLVGPSGSGKGAAEGVAAEALEVGHVVSHNVGSGEGIAHGYKRRTRTGLEWVDDTHAVLFSVPEIDSLAAQGDRRGATLMPQLRSGWTGEQLGFGYADPTKRIIVEAHQYRLCLVAGIQPGRAACLLDDADGGTPQRFLWMPATDPGAPDEPPAAPEPWRWAGVDLGMAGVGGFPMTVCDTARDTIRSSRLARLRGDGDALDGHALLAQLKTAAALAIADSRLDVSDEDWRLAGVIAAKSAAVRAGVVGHLAARHLAENTARAEAEAHRAVHIDERRAGEAVNRVRRKIISRLRTEGDWMPRSHLRKALSSTDRQWFDEALAKALDQEDIELDHTATGHGNSTGKYRLTGLK